MKKIAKYLFIVTILSTFFFSCKKKCDLGKNSDSGAIQTEINIFPESSNMTNGLTPQEYLVTGSSANAHLFKMSNDKGMTKTAVDYSRYSLLAFPTRSSCFSTFDRKVSIDDSTKVVLYTINIKECESCLTSVFMENWVAIPAVDSSYTVLFDVKQKVY